MNNVPPWRYQCKGANDCGAQNQQKVWECQEPHDREPWNLIERKKTQQTSPSSPQPNGSNQSMWWRKKMEKTFSKFQNGQVAAQGKEGGWRPTEWITDPFFCVHCRMAGKPHQHDWRKCKAMQQTKHCSPVCKLDVHLQGRQPQWPGNSSSMGAGSQSSTSSAAKWCEGAKYERGGSPSLAATECWTNHEGGGSPSPAVTGRWAKQGGGVPQPSSDRALGQARGGATPALWAVPRWGSLGTLGLPLLPLLPPMYCSPSCLMFSGGGDWKGGVHNHCQW